MTHLIDKDAVLAIIEKFMYGANIEADIASTGECFDEKIADAKYQLCKCIKGKINSLEAKEVDLEKEIKDYLYNQPIVTRCKGIDYKLVPSAEKIAKHFFELGLAASNPLTVKDIENIYHLVNKVADDIGIKAMYINIYQETLKRFKAQKGE